MILYICDSDVFSAPPVSVCLTVTLCSLTKSDVDPEAGSSENGPKIDRNTPPTSTVTASTKIKSGQAKL